ncbi:hypothetical protein SAMN05880574_12825 [Chryseobacterium sp. RU37D]|nr:hypothetical protein SAMN05880574_12825 [Chryseobacterium sp. RU37D]
MYNSQKKELKITLIKHFTSLYIFDKTNVNHLKVT